MIKHYYYKIYKQLIKQKKKLINNFMDLKFHAKSNSLITHKIFPSN